MAIRLVKTKKIAEVWAKVGGKVNVNMAPELKSHDDTVVWVD